ncbi:MAG: dTMP kinase [Verrucomicrobiota bacterium]|nr:dTMP kinase [Verrucomicrobiota bacterium]
MTGSGFLLALEGIDGAGKSTLAARLAGDCRARGIPSVVSREPTDGPHGTALRQSARTGRLSLSEELELFLEDRAEHVATLIAPALERGEVVILDRYYFSTAAYQGARGADPAEIIRRNEAFAPKPDLVLLLDLDPTSGRGRISSRGGAPDAFEGQDYLRKVRQIFLSFDRPFLRRVDAARPLDAVYAECLSHFEEALSRRRAEI